MRRFSLLVVLASCSSRDARPEPAPAPTGRAPNLTEQQNQAMVREIVQQASADTEPRARSCERPATIDRADVTGTLRVTEFGGKTMHLAVGNLDGGQLLLHAGATIHAGRTSLRARRDADDFERAIVVELAHSGQALDAVAGTLVIDTTKPVLAGHVENVDFREQREDFTYVTNGCTKHVGRLEFRFVAATR